jgi:hypothetical protein
MSGRWTLTNTNKKPAGNFQRVNVFILQSFCLFRLKLFLSLCLCRLRLLLLAHHFIHTGLKS